ncbi:MAG: hypothetical protein H6721_19200 [Sandaracinus sp.]|nr:hypothetical protein [Sandaracinus sp.]
MLWDQTTAPAGRYVVLYRGRGEIRYFGGAAEHVVERSPGRDVLDWNPGRDGAGLGLGIVRTDPADPIRDIRVLLPGGVCSSDQTRWCDASNPCSEGECRGFEASHEAQIFNPKFLAQLGRYGLVRFMNWQGTNASQARTWEERKRVSDARWSEGDGVPLEIVAELANRIGVDAWICIPHRADDRYVVEAGRLMHRLLAPERRVWLEYSNESWNSIFESWRYTRDEGLRLGLGGPEQDHTFAQIRFQARRSVEVFRKFSEGFPDRARVTRVLASHAPNDWISDQMLSWSGTASETDALAIAPYFGVLVNPSNRAEFLARDADETMRLAASELVPEAIGWMRAQKAVASRHHVELVAYEAGQHYVGVSGLEHDAELNRRLDALDRHPAWESVYTSYLDGWKSAGGGMMAHFLHCARPDGHGRFGLKHWLDEPDARSPRLRAVDAFIARTPRWW